MRLVADFADQHRLVGAGLQGHSLEGGLEALAQPSPQDDAVSARAHWLAPVLLGRAGTCRRRVAAISVFLRLADGPGGVDQADMAERLREVADHLAAGPVDLLGQQAHVVDRSHRALEGLPTL